MYDHMKSIYMNTHTICLRKVRLIKIFDENVLVAMEMYAVSPGRRDLELVQAMSKQLVGPHM